MNDNVKKELQLPSEGEYFEGDSGEFYVSRAQIEALDHATIDLIVSVMMLESSEKEIEVTREEDSEGMKFIWKKAIRIEKTFLGELAEHMSVVPAGEVQVPKALLMEDFGSPEVLYAAVQEFSELSQTVITISEPELAPDMLHFAWTPYLFAGTPEGAVTPVKDWMDGQNGTPDDPDDDTEYA